jgi:hypothetical protein
MMDRHPFNTHCLMWRQFVNDFLPFMHGFADTNGGISRPDDGGTNQLAECERGHPAEADNGRPEARPLPAAAFTRTGLD